MGSNLPAGVYTAEVKCDDGDNEFFTKIELVKNGVVVDTRNISQPEPVISFPISAAAGDYYYVRVTQKGIPVGNPDEMSAISSPIHFN